MKVQFGDDEGNGASRRAKIRALFVRGATIEAHTERCFRAGIWTESQNAMAAMAHHRTEVRDALGELQDGVPWAGETGDRRNGKPVWRQLDLWSYEDYVYNITRRYQQSKADIDVLNRIIERCLERYGQSPFQPLELIERNAQSDQN